MYKENRGKIGNVNKWPLLDICIFLIKSYTCMLLTSIWKLVLSAPVFNHVCNSNESNNSSFSL